MQTTKVNIGSKFKGPNFHLDTQAGTYWEVMPTFSKDQETLQKALLKKPKNHTVFNDCSITDLPEGVTFHA